MNTFFMFLFPLDKNDLVCQAHREGDEIELDHVWLKYTDILPVLEYEEEMHCSWLLGSIQDAAEEYRRERWRGSLMA